MRAVWAQGDGWCEVAGRYETNATVDELCVESEAASIVLLLLVCPQCERGGREGGRVMA